MEPALQLQWPEGSFGADESGVLSVLHALQCIVEDAAVAAAAASETTLLKVVVERRPRQAAGDEVKLGVRSAAAQAPEPAAGTAAATSHTDFDLVGARGSGKLLERLRRGEGCMLLAATPVMPVSLRPVIRCSWVWRLLLRRRLYITVQALLLLLGLISNLYSFELLESHWEAAGEHGPVPLTLKRPNWLMFFIHFVFQWCCTLLALCHTPLAVLRLTAFSFETVAIAVNGFVMYGAYIYNTVAVGLRFGTLSLQECVLLAVVYLCGPAWVPTIIANSDALMMPLGRVKVVAAVILWLLQIGIYFHTRFVAREWLATEVCWWSHCADARSIALAARLNVIIFMTKILGSYVLGRDFAVLRTRFQLGRSRPHASPEAARGRAGLSAGEGEKGLKTRDEGREASRSPSADVGCQAAAAERFEVSMEQVLQECCYSL